MDLRLAAAYDADDPTEERPNPELVGFVVFVVLYGLRSLLRTMVSFLR